ncbi:MAG TPA: type III-A CRISPR-associated protein Cas10/Csm1 [Chromatiales bacterium]|nr:type III-A CRISPR-associated protein Cas10/Csm1 [Chromatiales bacterium]
MSRIERNSLVLAGLLHDIGKLMQRAHAEGDLAQISPTSAEAESTFCPVAPDGRYTHRHVLWTDAFFEWLRNEVGVPPDIDLALAQKLACSHHRPEAAGEHEALAWILTEADRLSAGMDRRRDEDDPEARHRARRQPMRSPLAGVDIGRGETQVLYHRVTELSPQPEALYPVPGDEGLVEQVPEQYQTLWKRFLRAVAGLRQVSDGRHFLEGLRSQLERFTWAVPSSTVDTPDISLYDHVHTTAAIAACLWRYHGADTTPERVRDRGVRAYRLLAGDLSGIQRTLFTLAQQGARGAAKVLRARSFLLSAVVDAAALLALRALELPAVCRVQSAGGRFVLLVPALEGVEERVRELQHQINRWLLRRYLGGLGLNLALTPPFSGEDLLGERFLGVMDALGQAVEEAKQRPLEGVQTGPIPLRFSEHGPCSVCGVRPAAGHTEGLCEPCFEEERIGQRLPRARYVVYGPEKEVVPPLHGVPLPGGAGLAVVQELPRDLSAFWRVEGLGPRQAGALSWRALATYVPLWGPEEVDDPRYRMRDAGEEDAEPPRPGTIKTFHHLACDALERANGSYRGRALLAVLKADVDFLGFVFARGVPREKQSLSRFAGLSRMMDFFFSAHLPWILENTPEFRSTYTVYAGGDDLLLIGPWRQTAELALRLREAFHRYSGGNPNLTLSAAVWLVPPSASVARSALDAEHGLEQAKDQGRDRVWLFSRVLPWGQAVEACERAGRWVEWVDANRVTRGFLQRLQTYLEMRRQAERDPTQAAWRARLAYDVARNFKDKKMRFEVLGQVGLEPDLTVREQTLDVLPVALEWALHRIRK